MHLNYCEEYEKRHLSTEVTLCNYFTHLHNSESFSPGTCWCFYSTLRVHFLATCRVNIKNYAILKTLLKKFTADHISSKPHIFSNEEIQRGLTDLLYNEDPKYILHKIGTDDDDIDSSDDDDSIEMLFFVATW